MKYLAHSSAIIDVTKPPYCADNTGKTDCTATLVKLLDDILIHQVEELQKTHDKLVEISCNCTENVYIGIEGGRVQNGQLAITFPENEPASYIVYFPKGTYLVSDTVTYSLDNLKGFWYWVPGFENCRNIHFMGESREETVIRLQDHAPGYGEGAKKPLISFANHEMDVPRDREFTNVAFMNTIEDITLDCGKGNPGAVGIKYVSSNCGRIENVSIIGDGHCGVYVTNRTSQAVFSRLTVSGFRYGLDIIGANVLTLDEVEVSGNRVAGMLTGNGVLVVDRFYAEGIPAVEFGEGKGRYYFTDPTVTFANDPGENLVFFEESPDPRRCMPHNRRSEDPTDWVCVDDFGAVGDGVTDSTRAIQRAMNSGKSVILFGAGRYVLNAKIKIPKTVKTVDFMFCSLECGIRLVGGEYDAAFEIAEDSDELLFIENLSAWEQFRGHIRLIKHAAHRDTVISDIHLMSASLYFNSVPGSKVYLENCFLTTGTYTPNAWIPGDGFDAVYSRILPYEFHGQTVYGRQINPERADVHMLNDGSEILLDGYRIEGSGTALKSVNGGKTKINLFTAGLGKKDAQNPVFDLYDSPLTLNGGIFFGGDTGSEYNILFRNTQNGVSEIFTWDDAVIQSTDHGKTVKTYTNVT